MRVSPGPVHHADPYAHIRPALRAEHAALPPEQLRAMLGARPTVLALHRLLASPEPRQAVLAALLGSAGRSSIRLDGADVPLPAYLRLLSRLCGEAAAHGEQELAQPASWPAVAPSQETPPASPTPDPFPSANTLVLDRGDAALNAQMASLAADPMLSGLCAALVDLTGNPATPAYAGFNDQDMIFAGSLKKLSAAYAAFELRARVRDKVVAAIAAGVSTAVQGWESSVIAELEQDWRPKLAAAFPGLPANFPALRRIFTFSPAGGVDFAAAFPGLTDTDIDQVGEFGNPRGKFGDWLRSMLRWSNNSAASLCIRALGYSCINGTLAGAGFFDASLHNGLWLSADYENHDWLPNPPNNPQANRAGQPLSPRWQRAQGRRLSNATATASQVASLLTLLARNALLTDASDNRELRGLMTGDAGIGSYVGHALRHSGRSITTIASKIGYGDDRRSHDCAIVERATPSGPICYVVVGLGSRPGARDDLSRLFVSCDDIVTARHP